MPSGNPDAYDIAIIGAGPAGATCALALRDSGLRIALIDKAEFPRDKVCGDAIPARCAHVLRRLDPTFAEALEAFPTKVGIGGCRVVAPNGNQFDYRFYTGGYCSKRLDFDHFLLELALEYSKVDLITGETVRELKRKENGWEVGAGEKKITAKVVVGCDGANGITAKLLADFKMSPEHHCAAVRGYYSGVSGLEPDMMEIHFPEAFLPGYFWIFPLPEGQANVGFGMLSNKLAGSRMNMRKSLPAIIEADPKLRLRFENADLLGPITGFGLPMGSRKVAMSGDGFLLCGDAASLIEPATGEGIGNAMLSASLAAEWLLRAFESGRFDAEYLSGYDREVYGKVWRDLRNKYRAQRILGERKWLMNWLVNRANKKGLVQALLKKVF